MGRYFTFRKNSPKLKSTTDLAKIREYLEMVGELNCATIQLCRLWDRFSKTLGDDWLTPDIDTLSSFAKWLSEYDKEVY